MIPKCKVETYTGATLDHTITDDLTNVHVRMVLNGVGTFAFAVPVFKGTTGQGYNYTDIVLNDTVKVYFWYDNVENAPTTPNFAGKICKISGVMAQGGFYRVFEGKSLGEVLERRLKRNKGWQNTAASTIVTELANDLGLGTSDTLSVAQTYLDVLKDISDYWVDATTQIKKDFYVDVDNDLVWKSRPIRSTGVETLSVGENIQFYGVIRSILPVKNKIYVYGDYAFQDYYWTDSLDHWTAVQGTMSQEGISIKMDSDAEGDTEFCRTTNPYPFIGGYKPVNPASADTLSFQYQMSPGVTNQSFTVRLEAPDSSNYFYQTFTGFSLNDWHAESLTLGPSGNWSSSGSPSWTAIYKLRFITYAESASYSFYLKELKVTPLQLYGAAENSASQNSYGVRELQVTDSLLQSDSLCEKRAETLLYQLKDPPVRVDLTINGNTNVKIGDRLSLTIPAENISAQNFDVLAVEHDYVKGQGWSTKANLVSAGDIRQLPSGSPLETIKSHFETQRKVARGVQLVR